MGMMQDFAQARAERRRELAAMRRELSTDLAKVTPALRGAEDERRRAEAQNSAHRRSEIKAMHSEVKTMRSDAQAMLSDLSEAHTTMGRELRANLAKDVSALRQDASALLKELDKAHAATSRKLRADLTKDVSALRGAEAKRRRTEAQNIAHRGSDVAAIHFEVWGRAAPPKAKTAPAPSRTEAPPAEPPKAEAAPPPASVRDQVFQYLADHPDGARMTELEAEFGMARIQLATLLRSLQDDNKVEKRDLFYFAI